MPLGMLAKLLDAPCPETECGVSVCVLLIVVMTRCLVLQFVDEPVQLHEVQSDDLGAAHCAPEPHPCGGVLRHGRLL